jgi:23S rRNA (adenine2030-N6)-methyltransferase
VAEFESRDMNYRHAFHAGNFADVMKHAALVRVIEYLKRKPAAFRFLDTHAGVGFYDLSSEAATRSPEWREGIGKLIAPGGLAPVAAEGEYARALALLAPYLELVAAVNRGQGASALTFYPGSGEIARRMLRQDDRAVLIELRDEDAQILRQQMRHDTRVKTLSIDGWRAVKSLLPPKERRGVTLIDPPFEEGGEFHRLEAALRNGARRFQGGVMLLWYPIKAGGEAERFTKRLAGGEVRRLLMAELLVRHPDQPGRLNGSGLIVRNPPYGLDQELGAMITWLVALLGQAAGAGSHVTWLVGE